MTDSDHDKIIRTEEKVDALSSIVYQIRDNHLTHIANSINDVRGSVKEIHEKVDNINVKLGLWSGAIMVGMWVIERFIK